MKPYLLVVDDEPFVRKLMVMSLTKEFYCLEAASGIETLDTLHMLNTQGHLKHVAGVLLDVKMPDTDGFDVLKELKRSYPLLPVIMCTAMSTVEGVTKAVSAGASGYVVKPFSGSGLREKVSKALCDCSVLAV